MTPSDADSDSKISSDSNSKISSNTDSHADSLGGLIDALAQSLSARTFVKLTLGKGVHPDLQQAFIRLVDIQKAPHLSILFRYQTKDLTENHPVADGPGVVRALLSGRFRNAHLFTTEADIELLRSKKGDARLLRHKPTFHAPPDMQHNRVKRYLLDPARAPYLRELGIVTAEGKVKSDKADKYRQLQNIIKILDEFAGKSSLREQSRLRIIDMGCGKGYLTFALHDYFNHQFGIATEVIGVDQNQELMALCNGVAQKLGLTGLSFQCSTVDEFDLGEADVLVALHACDTATDTALYKGVAAGASILMVVPCCQKELRPQLKVPAGEQPFLKHDTFKDRFSQMLTDSMRGLLLEAEGYRTRIMEFISDAHTHRNVMIVGVRDAHYREREARRSEVEALAARYHITKQHLQTLLTARAPH